MKEKRSFLIQVILLSFITLAFFSVNLFAAETQSSDPNKYLDAVREFADNVLEYGRDTYGPLQTPLFVDGVNVNTHEPVKWINPDGTQLILSDFASCQSLLRTLDSLSALTGDLKYRQAARAAIEYALTNLRTPNGLFYWGEKLTYGAQADRVLRQYTAPHTFKGYFPYYELMWGIDPNATEDFIETVWAAHILDWTNLAMDRIASTWRLTATKGWDHEYIGGPVFFARGLSFCNAGADLYYAAVMLSQLSGQQEPLVWGKRLAYRYVETRDPRTGISGYMYSRFNVEHPLAKYFEGHDVYDGTILCDFGGGDPSLRGPFLHIYTFSPGLLGNYGCYSAICYLLVSQTLGGDKEFQKWALEELTARGKVAYRSEDNCWVPMLTDGTSLEGFVCPEDIPGLVRKGSTIKAWQADLTDFWAYALAYKASGDEFMWTMARNILRGNQLGDIGRTPNDEILLNMNTDCANAHALLGFLSLYDKSQQQAFLIMAERIGDNILAQKFNKGFFVAGDRYTYARLDAVEALVLLHLYASLNPDMPEPPQVWPWNDRFSAPYRQKGEVYDSSVIYTLTDVNEPPLSINEAAAMGDDELVKRLITEGADVNNVESDEFITPLHRAAQRGFEEIIRLLLAEGADINAIAAGLGTPLDCAVREGHKEIVELLIAQGADVNIQDREGLTPLHIACISGNKDLVALLLTRGADINAADRSGRTPLDLAQQQGHDDIVKLLTEYKSETPEQETGTKEQQTTEIKS